MGSQLEMMRIDERPWVSISCDVVPKEGHPVARCINLNSGKTPAKHVQGYLFFRSFPADSGFTFISNDEKDQPKVWHGFRTNVLFPNNPHPSITELMRQDGKMGDLIPWTPEMQDAYDSGQTYFELHGRYTYDDAAGVSHWTQYCDLITGSHAKSLNFDVGMKCNEYNKVDDNK